MFGRGHHGNETQRPSTRLVNVRRRRSQDDKALVQQTIERASQDLKDFDFEHRLLMRNGSVKRLHVIAHAIRDESHNTGFVGAVMDVTEQHEARAALETAFEEIKKLKDQLYKENIALREEIDSASMFEEVVGASLGGDPGTRVGSGGCGRQTRSAALYS
jgi:formate hydrogenlyase transcriptional activator